MERSIDGSGRAALVAAVVGGVALAAVLLGGFSPAETAEIAGTYLVPWAVIPAGVLAAVAGIAWARRSNAS